jgi:predicted enzyme related to lactoylglutathione lyase
MSEAAASERRSGEPRSRGQILASTRRRLGPVNPKEERIVDWKLELVAVPVSDVDRAKAFYTEQVGFVADHDVQVDEDLRFVQLTPPGSACSIAMGTGIADTPPGSLQGLQMVVADIHAAHEHLRRRGVDVTDVEVLPWGSFVQFRDPDGNGWAVQQLPPRG